MRSRPSRDGRAGFTLVELLIAAAVSILLMIILTEAFKAGLDMFRKMRAQGNLMTRLREASVTIRDDLTAPHFPTDRSPNRPNLSQQDLPDTQWTPPTDGCFRIMQGLEPENLAVFPPGDPRRNNPFVFEGLDPEGIMYCRCTNHMMQFTVQRGGTGPDDMFRTLEPQRQLPSGNIFPRDWVQPQDYLDNLTTFSSRWAQITYFMRNTGDRTKPTPYNPNGLPLFDLCRRVQLLVPLLSTTTMDGTIIPPAPFPANGQDNPDISAIPAGNHQVLVREGWNTGSGLGAPPSVDQPRFRFGMNPASAAGIPLMPDIDGRQRPPTIQEEYNTPYQRARWGDDILLSDVVSFEVKAVWATTPLGGGAATGPSGGGTNVGGNYVWQLPGFGPQLNTDTPFDYLPTPQWGNQSPPAQPTNPALAAAGYRVFDTWSRAGTYGDPGLGWNTYIPNLGGTPNTIPLKLRIKAIQIRIRVWDRKSEQTRQITIVQDM